MSVIGKTSIIKNKCINCSEVLDMATSVEHEVEPHEGAIAVCGACGHVMAFDPQLKFRELTDEEILAVAGSKDLLATQKVAEFVKLEKELEKEILPIFTKMIESMEIQTRQEKISDNDEYGWFARNGNDPSSEIGFGDTEGEAVKDLLTDTLRGLVHAVAKRKRRN
jgi:hypothetical protein